MTDDSKAIQILRTIRGSWIPSIGAVFSPIECIQAMMAMVEWKDQQFKEYLEKKQSLLKSTLETYQDNETMHYSSPRKQKTICSNLELELSLINEIINELFREVKE